MVRSLLTVDWLHPNATVEVVLLHPELLWVLGCLVGGAARREEGREGGREGECEEGRGVRECKRERGWRYGVTSRRW